MCIEKPMDCIGALFARHRSEKVIPEQVSNIIASLAKSEPQPFVVKEEKYLLTPCNAIPYIEVFNLYKSLFRDQDVRRFLYETTPYAFVEIALFVDLLYKSVSRLRFAISNEYSDESNNTQRCGQVSISLELDENGELTVSLGIVIMKEYWNRGIGEDALTAIFNILKGAGVKTVSATVHLDNAGSNRLFEKVFGLPAGFNEQDPQNAYLYSKKL